ncbi:MAG: hypothetical protein ACRD3R_12465, partial [Terriglobales bacterium]
MKLARSLLISVMLPWHSVVWAVPFDDPFSSLDWGIWCPCQINMAKAPIAYIPDPDSAGNTFARIVAVEASLGGNVCKPQVECAPPTGSSAFALHGFDKKGSAELDLAPDRPEPLGPSL